MAASACFSAGAVILRDRARISSISAPRSLYSSKNGLIFQSHKSRSFTENRSRSARGVPAARSFGDLPVEEGDGVWIQRLEAIGGVLSSLFPVWVGIACVAALVRPSAFLWIKGQLQMVGITITMLGMGMTLSIDDLKGALSMPREVAAGVFLQYTIMPLTGATVARVLGLPSHYAAGLVLVSCCPGGTASNVVTYLARGNVALSVIMTAISTFLAVVMTPLLTAKLAGQYVAVDANALVLSTLQVVLLPVLTGAGMAHYLPGLVRILSPLAPTVAVVTIAAVCAGAIAQSAAAITTTGAQIFVAVAMLHASGFLLGYLAAKVIRFSESTARTISIEVGMQNSVLGVVLANQHFTSPLTAVPCAISSVCHSVFGSALAGFWQASSQGPSES
ncbi:probable sodium/metabolite cotransporter BASS1, chloroplastic [Selaginella moellendorffii]|nr:probable sodium/metabolite cotransporter BASS1, chloroplastic [Selaginella moellendorffii]XP_024529874.1 probable sodium/metabolite cotransporter BASS1, chloroplastic [Selaginella moellendorffii]|eukprot:XP_024529868.1 probable sodium/metabolite cotransporter BASS1, chloroplastic [Selaginella moellendorffii]